MAFESNPRELLLRDGRYPDQPVWVTRGQDSA